MTILPTPAKCLHHRRAEKDPKSLKFHISKNNLSLMISMNEKVIAMLKKIMIAAGILAACSVSYAFGFATGGSNMGYMYPSFSAVPPYDASAESMGRYIDEAKEYVDNCNSDIQRIIDARNQCIETVNMEVNSYNYSHSY